MSYLPLDEILTNVAQVGTFEPFTVMPTVLATSSGDTASFVTRSLGDGTILVIDTAPGYLSITGSETSDGYLDEVISVLNQVVLPDFGNAVPSTWPIWNPSEVVLAEPYVPTEEDTNHGNLATVMRVLRTPGGGTSSEAPRGVVGRSTVTTEALYTIFVHAVETWPTF